MIRQHAVLIAKQVFTFRHSTKGRAIAVGIGQRFWVTSSATMQAQTGYVTIDRHGKGHISCGYSFTPAQIEQLFDITED